MPDPDAELEARLRAATDAAIAKVLAERKLPAEASLADTLAPERKCRC